MPKHPSSWLVSNLLHVGRENGQLEWCFLTELLGAPGIFILSQPRIYLGLEHLPCSKFGEHAWKCHGCAELLPLACPVQLARYWLWAPGPVTPAVAWADWVCPCSPAVWVSSFQEQAHRSKFYGTMPA